MITLLSGVTEPIFAFITFFLSVRAAPFILSFNAAFAAAAMIYITVDELIPEAYRAGYEHSASIGLIVGILLSIYLLRMLAT